MIRDELNSLRPKINSWTLANDTTLRLAIEKFTDGIAQKLDEQEKLLKETVQECTRAQIRIENVNNKISHLKNFKFIQHKIKEDDEPIVSHKPIYIQKTKEERQGELVDSIKQAVANGFSMIDNNFKKIEVKASDFDDDLDNSYIPDPIFEPLNPYLRRPLPHIIGSENFYKSVSAGLDERFDKPEKKIADEEVVIELPQPVIRRKPTQVVDSNSNASFHHDERASTTPSVHSLTSSIPSRESSPKLDQEEVPAAIKISKSNLTPILPGGNQHQLFEELFRKTKQIPATITSNDSPKSQRSAHDTISDNVPSFSKDSDRSSVTSKTSKQSGVIPKSSIFADSDDDNLLAKNIQSKPVQTPIKPIEVPKIVANVNPKTKIETTNDVKKVAEAVRESPKLMPFMEKSTVAEPSKIVQNIMPTNSSSVPKTNELNSTALKKSIEEPKPTSSIAHPQSNPVVQHTSKTTTPKPNLQDSNMGLKSSKKKSIFDDSDSESDLFVSAKSSKKSSVSSKKSNVNKVPSIKEKEPEKRSSKQLENPKIPPQTSTYIKKKSLFDSDSSEDELFKPVPNLKSSSTSSQKNFKPADFLAKTDERIQKEPEKTKIDKTELKFADIEKITVSGGVSLLEDKISTSPRPASVASTSALEQTTSQKNDDQLRKPKIQVSDNNERGPSSVAARIAQIGMKIPVGPPGIRRPMSMVEDITLNGEKAEANEGKKEDQAPKLSSIVKTRPKGPARRAPTTHRHTLAPTCESNESTSASETDATLLPSTKESISTSPKLQEIESTLKKSLATQGSPPKPETISNLPPRPPSTAAADNMAKLAQAAFEKRKLTPKSSLESTSEKSVASSKASLSPKTSLSPKMSPTVSPTLIRNRVAATAKEEIKKKSIFESSSDEEIIKPSAQNRARLIGTNKNETSATTKTVLEKNAPKTSTTTVMTKKSNKGLFDDSDSDLDIFKKK